MVQLSAKRRIGGNHVQIPAVADWLAKRFLFKTAIVVCLIGCSQAVVIGADAKVDLDAICRAWRDRQERVKSFQVSWSGQEFVAARPASDEPGSKELSDKYAELRQPHTFDYGIVLSCDQQDRMRGETSSTQWSNQQNKLVAQASQAVWDGKVNHALIQQSGDFSVASIGSVHTTGIGRSIQLVPWTLAFRPLDPLFGDFKESEIVLESKPVVVGGRECLIFDATRTRQSWGHLEDLDRSFARFLGSSASIHYFKGCSVIQYRHSKLAGSEVWLDA